MILCYGLPPLLICVCVCVCVCVYICVCVCVCVIYILSTLILVATIYVIDYFRSPGPFAIPAIRQIRCLPCYTPTTFPHRIRVLDLVYSLHSLQYPLNLFTPGRKKCHHRPIHQLRLLLDARPFVPRYAEEYDIRPHYC